MIKIRHKDKCQDECKCNIVAVKTVTDTYINETDELIHIGVNGETISATPTHPFYVDKLGWTLARLYTKKAKPIMNRLCFLHI